MTVFYMSFVIKGQGFVGACLVEAENAVDAVGETWILGCNPGGEIRIIEPTYWPDQKWFNRLLSRADLAEVEVELNEKFHKDNPKHTPGIYQ